MSLGDALLWALLATSALTLVMTGGQRLGFSRMSVPTLLGTMWTANRDRALLYGLISHAINGMLLSFLYYWLFDQLGRSPFWLGALVGLGHGLFVFVVVIPTLPGLHPRMASAHHGPSPTPMLEPPGVLALNYGRRTPMIGLVAHALYGLLLAVGHPPLG